MPTLSAVLITKNATRHLIPCLTSLHFCDEIIVVDSGSSDDTVAVASHYHAKVFIATDWQGFGVQKNRALAQASCEWILSIDADEYLTDELQQEIQEVLKNPMADIYQIPRLSAYCGRWMRHSGWYPDYVTRLFRRGSACFSEDLVHERLLIPQTVQIATLQYPLQHRPFDSLEDVLFKVNAYSSAGAMMAYQRGKRGSVWRAITHGLWSFMRTYFVQGGFLDGREGFLLAISNAEGTYYRYLKLMYLHENRCREKKKE